MKYLIRQLDTYSNELKQTEEELLSLPKGQLLKNASTYYHTFDCKQVGITKKPDLVRALARKKYLLIRKRQLEKNIAIVKKALQGLDVASPSEIAQSLPAAYQGLPSSYRHHPEVDKDCPTIPYRPEECIYFSNNGVGVRSKSEAIIANLLEKYGLSYRYEAGIRLGSQTKYPDFTIVNPYNGDLVLWEHFGALHQEGYEDGMNSKMGLYLKHGYVPFENLIYTFEFDIRNQGRLESLVQGMLPS